MLTDLLFIAFFFFTRIGLPILVTYLLGVVIERALHRPATISTARTFSIINL
ncbi:MAG: hypothetical protein N2559_09220 [Anaerolineae bacterium]|nr:hypothetical protein [Anaerolineae bacterium]